MPGETNLDTLLASMRPELQPGRYVFVTLPQQPDPALVTQALASFREDEGLTLVLPEEAAAEVGGEGPFCCLTLSVHSSLDAVGLTAAVAQSLTDAGISANVWAAYYHDHVFVPAADAAAALQALQVLASGAER